MTTPELSSDVMRLPPARRALPRLPLRRLPWRKLAYLGVCGVMLGAIVHLASVLAIPMLATRNADARLAALAPRHVVTLLPRVEPGDTALPYRDPATALAVCRFDLSDGPVRIRASAGDLFMSLAFHQPEGGVFYALTDRGATRGQIEALIVTPDQLEALQANDPEDEPVRELRLVSARKTGFVTLRALAPEPSLLPDAEQAVSRARCTPEAAPPPVRKF